MKTEIKLDIQAQPDDESCGATCLHALYRHWGLDDVPLKDVVAGIEMLESGGTIAELLACDALRRGFDATVYTFHLQMFDPTWFAVDGAVHDPADMSERLQQQLSVKPDNLRLRVATRACREFLSLGGTLRMQDLTIDLIIRHLSRGIPIITGLSSTFLYREKRALPVPVSITDDVCGEPQGHFVMIVGYDSAKRELLIADPLDPNPPFHTAKFRLSMDRLMNAILLGILTHDANLLVVQPRNGKLVPLRKARRGAARTPKKKGNRSRPSRRDGVPKKKRKR
jgi:hypothetical protein